MFEYTKMIEFFEAYLAAELAAKKLIDIRYKRGRSRFRLEFLYWADRYLATH